MAKSIIYKLLTKNNLIDERKIFAAGTIKSSSIKDDSYDGRCLVIKDQNLVICRLGGRYKIAPLYYLEKKDIKKLSIKPKILGTEYDICIQTNYFFDIYNITVNKKKVKDIFSLFSPF